MKKKITLVAFAILGIATFIGCKKSSGTSYSMKAKVGSTSYNAGYCVASSVDSLLTIDGIASANGVPTPPYFTIGIYGWAGKTGTYTLDSSATSPIATYYANSTTSEIASSGSIVITSVSSTTISGTFSFTCTDGTSISGGSFTAKID